MRYFQEINLWKETTWYVCLVGCFSVDTGADGAPVELQACLHGLPGLSRGAETPGVQPKATKKLLWELPVPISMARDFKSKEIPERAARAGPYKEWELCGGQALPRVLYFKKRFQSSVLLEEAAPVKQMTKKSTSKSCCELGVTATSLFLTGNAPPDEEACF